MIIKETKRINYFILPGLGTTHKSPFTDETVKKEQARVLKRIIETIKTHYDVDVQNLKTRQAHHVKFKMAFTVVMRERTTISRAELTSIIRLTDRSCVNHYIQKHSDYYKYDANYKAFFDEFKSIINDTV